MIVRGRLGLLMWGYVLAIGATTGLLIAALISASPASPHDQWADGSPVPAWVKAQCCGPEDVHHLKLSDIEIRQDGYHIKGLETIVPFSKALPSPDGQVWGFWSPRAEPDPTIYCFFYPIQGY